MPTITSATVTTLLPGTPGKGPASLLAGGEPSFDFQTLLGATAIVAPPIVADPVAADQPARQLIAADGTALPVEMPTATLPGAPPVDMVAPIVLAKIAPKLMSAAPVEEPSPPAPDKIVPLLAAIPTAAPRQLPIVSTKVALAKREPDASDDGDEADVPADPSTLLPTAPPVPPVPIAPPVPPVQTPVISAGSAKTSPLQLISVARAAPAARPVLAAAIPQTARDIRWDGPAPAATPLAAPAALPTVQPLPMQAPPGLPLRPVTTTAVAAAPQPVAVEAVPIAAMQSPPPKLPAQPPVALPTAAAPVVVPAAIVVGPALQVFGAAISAAARHERGEEAADPLASLGSIAAPAAPIASPAATADQPMLDMRQERWPQAMIAHIESLRDNANAGDTRIRLIPDALGTIDVAVTRDRDTVHVQFSAEQATTRTLIQDAQPRLAALAEERGLRLGQTVVDASATNATSQQPQQSQQQRQPQRDAALPATPRRATEIHDDQDRADDGRLA